MSSEWCLRGYVSWGFKSVSGGVFGSLPLEKSFRKFLRGFMGFKRHSKDFEARLRSVEGGFRGKILGVGFKGFKGFL